MPGAVNPASEFFKDGLWGWDGTVWRKLPLLFGYTDRWMEDCSEAGVAGGNWGSPCTAVGPGYIYVLQCASVRNTTGQRGDTHIQLCNAGGAWSISVDASPEKNIPVLFDGAVVLKEGDYINFFQRDTVAGDNLYAFVWGYKMEVGV